MNRITYKGFSLIEVMIALVIMAVGLLALSKFHSELFRSTSDAQSRTTALVIVEAKLEDLRSFSQISQPDDGASPPNDIPWSAGADPMSYVYISDDSGGVISAGASPSIGGTTYTGYTLTWNVTDYWHDFDAIPPVDNTAGTGVSDFKQIEAIVTWTDEKGVGQQVSLMQNISSTSPGGSYILANATSGSPGPSVTYTPGEVPDVIPVCLGDDCNDGTVERRETTKPLPDVVQTGQRSNTIVSFTTVNYDDPNAADDTCESGVFCANTREEFITTNCKCEVDSLSSNGQPATHLKWENDQLTHVVPDDITKTTAVSYDNDTQADIYCDVCCRDHHDASTGPKYVEGTANNSNHAHYDVDGRLINSLSVGDIYVESCRLKRVDGLWRVFQDWKLEHLSVLPRDFLTTSTNRTSYTSGVTTFLKTGTFPTATYEAFPGATSANSVELNLAETKQYQARAVYVDSVIEGDGNTDSYIDYSATQIDQTPFYEINTTLLALWSPEDLSLIDVSSAPIDTVIDPDADYYGTYSRGLVTGVAGTSVVKSFTASMYTGNEALTNIFNDGSVAKTEFTRDSYATVSSSLSSTFTVSISGNNAKVDSIEIDGVICPETSRGEYSCTILSAPAVITITVDLSYLATPATINITSDGTDQSSVVTVTRP